MNARHHPDDPGIESLRVPPHSVEAEQAVLGGLILRNAAMDIIADVVVEGDFYRHDHRLLWRAIVQQLEDNKPADILTLTDELKRRGQLQDVGGLQYLHSIAQGTPSTANIRRYAEIVRDRAIVRRIAEVGVVIADSAYNSNGRGAKELLEQAETKVLEIGESGRGRVGSGELIGASLADVMTRLDDRMKNPASVTGVATGFVDLDEMTTGLQGGDLIVIAGRPSMGKTSLAMNIAEWAALELKLPVLTFSMEMSKAQLSQRLLGSVAKVDAQKLRTARLDNEDWDRLGHALSKLNAAPIVIDDDASLTPFELRARARRKAREYGGLGLVIVDYIQLMTTGEGRNDNRATELGEISRALKLMARELNCPVIALSQLNRSLEQRANKRPMMSDLRESGAIEQDADLIFFVYRDEVYFEDSPDKGVAEIIVGKQRNGPIGTVKLTFMGKFTRFENYSGMNSYGEVNYESRSKRRAFGASEGTR